MSIFQVRDFGATGDGVTDDRAAVQAALDAVPDGGGTVFVAAGDYRLGDSLIVSRAGTWLRGVGVTSILRLMDSIQKCAIALPNDPGALSDPTVFAVGVTISDLCLDGNSNTPVLLGNPDYFGIFARQTTGLTVRRVAWQHWPSDGISVSNGNAANTDLTIEDCWIDSCHRNGIHLGFVDGATIRRCRITDTPSQVPEASAANAIDLEVEGYDQLHPPGTPSVRNVVIEDCILERPAAATAGDGVQVAPAYGPLENITVRRCLIRGHQFAVAFSSNSDPRAAVPGITTAVCADNWLTTMPGQAAGGCPVVVAKVSGATVSGNKINDAGFGVFSGGGGGGGAISVYDSLDVEITGNTARLWTEGTNYLVPVANTSATVAVGGNHYQTTAGVLGDDGTNSGVTQSGNVDVSGTPWDLTPPTVAWIPADGTVVAIATFLGVTASDAGSGVDRVWFFVDGVPAGLADAAPYGLTFDPALYTAGPHTVSALAVDGLTNAATVSLSIEVSTQAPQTMPIPSGILARYKGDFGLFQDTGAVTPCATQGDAVALWQDQSGNGYHLTVPATFSAPVYQAAPGYLGMLTDAIPPASFGNRPYAIPGVMFNGSSQGLSNAAFNAVPGINSDFSYYVIFQLMGATNVLCGMGSDGQNFYAEVNGSSGGLSYFTQGGGAPAVYMAGPGQSVYSGRAVAWPYSHSSSPTFKMRIRDSGHACALTVVGFSDPGAVAAGLWLGANGAPHYFNGTVLEWFVYDHALSSSEIDSLDAYAKTVVNANIYSHLVCVGDSITVSYPISVNNDPAAYGSGNNSWPLQLWHALDPSSNRWSVCNQSTINYTYASPTPAGGGGSIQDLAVSVPNYFDPFARANILTLEGGINDIHLGRTDTQVIADIETTATPLVAAGFKVILWTVMQTGVFTGAMPGYRTSVNTWIRNSAISGGFAHAIYDTDVGGFTDPTDASLYETDQVHNTPTGVTLHAANLLPIVQSLLTGAAAAGRSFPRGLLRGIKRGVA